MDLDAGAAIVAGLIGGGVMAVLLYMGIAMIPTQMKMNLFQMLGTMMVPAGTMTYIAGAMMHAMMSIVFGLIHAALYPADVGYLYFVSRNDGSHVFANSLREHNRNVQEYQVRYFRRRR